MSSKRSAAALGLGAAAGAVAFYILSRDADNKEALLDGIEAFREGVILRSGGPLWLILAGGRRETSHSVRGLLGRPKGSFRHTITHLQLH